LIMPLMCMRHRVGINVRDGRIFQGL
jgi:hypothetical protein